MIVYETFDKDFMFSVNRLLESAETVLDIGSGIGVLLEKFACSFIVALDVHRPFLENRVFKSAHILPIHANAYDIDLLFLPKTFAAVTLVDSIEHFTKDVGQLILKKAELLARDKVIVFTPRGFFPQSVDHYGLNGDVHQTHYCGWEPEDFTDLGYEVLIFKDFHDASNHAFVESFGSDHPPIDALLAWKSRL
ncbi:class I SAM-dependent methyltransferase [Paenibacillus solisilvae]|uniref:Class I SAM-dependent methyltransferase n=1 Tax=Paenibacillus solisilvae TaxID=2486751 RepID=A0ABW0VU30_9BACL